MEEKNFNFDNTNYVIKKDSKREIDEENGYLRVNDNILTSACVSEYVGKEILNYEKFGIDPNSIVKLLRPVDELKKAINSFKGIPITFGHIYWDVKNPPKSIGSIGTDVFFDEKEKAIMSSLIITDKYYIDLIMEDKITGLSCGYNYLLKKESGEFNGEKYDYKMYELCFNHVALVDDPRVEKSKIADDASQLTKNKNEILKGKKNMFNLYEIFKLNKMGKMFAKDADVNIEDIESSIFEALKDENANGEQKHEIIKDLLNKLKAVLSKQNATDEDSTVETGVSNDEDKVDKVEAKDEQPEDKVEAKDENISEEEKEKILDEDLVLAEDEDVDTVIEKQTANDSKKTLLKLVNFNKSIKAANSIMGNLDEKSFNYNPTKVLDYVLKNKNIAMDSKSKFNDKLNMVKSLSKNQNENKEINFANDSKSNSNVNEIDELLNKALKF